MTTRLKSISIKHLKYTSISVIGVARLTRYVRSVTLRAYRMSTAALLGWLRTLRSTTDEPWRYIGKLGIGGEKLLVPRVLVISTLQARDTAKRKLSTKRRWNCRAP